MRRYVMHLAVAIALVAIVTVEGRSDTIVQQPGTNFLIVEAEAFNNDDLNNPDTGWLVISPDDPVEVQLHSSNPGTIMVPPPSSNPSGNQAILDLVGGGDFADQLTYALQFDNPGVYYVYLRYSLFDLRSLFDNNYGNEDSIYLPVEEINEDPTLQYLRDTRDGFVGLTTAVNDVTVTPLDGCRILEEPWVLSDEECDAEGLRGPEQMEGQYHWTVANWNNGLGHANYLVEDTGTVLDFSIATRERGTSLDAIVFSQSPDLLPEDLDELLFGGGPTGETGDFDNSGALDAQDIDLLSAEVRAGTNTPAFDLTGDGLVNGADRTEWVDVLKNTYLGDANLDGEFNSGDLVAVFTVGHYEDGIAGNSGWAQGDWNGDTEFDSSDFVAAFSAGGYEQGPRGAVASVPEPASGTLAWLALAGIAASVRRRSSVILQRQ